MAEPIVEETETGYVRQLREGWDFLRGDRVLLGISVMVAMTNLLDAAYTEAKVGRRVEVTFQRLNDDITLPQFRLAH